MVVAKTYLWPNHAQERADNVGKGPDSLFGQLLARNEKFWNASRHLHDTGLEVSAWSFGFIGQITIQMNNY